MLLFKFALPDAKHMGDMTPLIALVPYYIDLIGRYKLGPQVGQPVVIFSCMSYQIISFDLNIGLVSAISGSIKNRDGKVKGCARGIQGASKCQARSPSEKEGG